MSVTDKDGQYMRSRRRRKDGKEIVECLCVTQKARHAEFRRQYLAEGWIEKSPCHGDAQIKNDNSFCDQALQHNTSLRWTLKPTRCKASNHSATASFHSRKLSGRLSKRSQRFDAPWVSTGSPLIGPM